MKTSSIEPIRYLNRAEMDTIHQSALRILERTGMWVDHPKALGYLRAAGCRVDMDRRIVKFPPEVVEAAVNRMRQNFQALANRCKSKTVSASAVGAVPMSHGDSLTSLSECGRGLSAPTAKAQSMSAVDNTQTVGALRPLPHSEQSFCKEAPGAHRAEKPTQMAVRYSQVRFDAQPFRVHEDFTVSAGGFCVFICDLDGQRRRATLQDVRQSLKLADRLDQIAYTGLPCAAQDMPVEVRPVVMAAELVKATRKLGGIETFRREHVGYIARIGEIVAGSREAHRREPILVGYAEARTPLCIDAVMADVMLAHLELGLPQSLDTMPNGGATAPMTAAGILALGLAETLGGLVLGFAVDSNATMTLDITPGYCDMRSMHFGYAGAERVPLLAARVQLISEYYGCPSGIHGGKTDACVAGIQVGVEKALSMYAAVMAGAIGFGTVGHLENAVTFSPLQLVIDNEIARYVRRAVRGIEVSDETLALDVIEQTGINANTFDHEHTTCHYRDEELLSPFFDCLSWGAGDSLDRERFEKRAAAKARELLAAERAPVLSAEQEAAIDEIVKEATMDLRA